jgi:hypothetical protein
VEPEIDEPPARPDPLAVPEALDYLALAWKVAFKRLLFRDRSLVMDAALAVECHSLSELESLLSKLADVFNAMLIGDDLLPASGQAIPRAHSLARLLAALKNALPAERHVDVDRAVGMLQAVNSIRTGYQHQERRASLLEAFGTLRLPWPPESPAATWDGIRARVIEAVGVIRDTVRSLETPDPATATPQGPAAGS